MSSHIGKILILTGGIILVTGILVFFFGNKLNFLGKLPGDIRIEKEHIRIYIPITTMILLSIIVSLILYYVKKFFH